jgi:hypothetical protein
MQEHKSVVRNMDRNIETIVDMLRKGQAVKVTRPFYEGQAITTFEPDAGRGPLAFTTSTVIELDADCQLARRLECEPEVKAAIDFIAKLLSAASAQRVKRALAGRGVFRNRECNAPFIKARVTSHSCRTRISNCY